MDYPNNYCSACQDQKPHHLHTQNYLRRNVYRCGGCDQLTVSCVVPGCKHMARTGEYWDDNLCAEHDGSVPSLRAAKMRLAHLAEYDQVLKHESIDFSNAGKWAATAASVTVPVVGMALGGAHFALKRAGLMSTLANDSHFHIWREHDSKDSRHAVVFINGLGSQHARDVKDWKRHLIEHFPRHSWFHVDWEAQRLLSLSLDMVRKTAKIANAVISPAGLVGMAYDNVWHAAVRNSENAGILLADAIARNPGWRFTLAGHSLGARVIRFALVELARRGIKCVDDVYLLGGAVGGKSKHAPHWEQALKAMDGTIYNCHSLNDKILAQLYYSAAMGSCVAAGHRGIELQHKRLRNVNCDELVLSHTAWKDHFGEILQKLGAAAPPGDSGTERTVAPASIHAA